jgi:hypothetical protein
MLVELAMRTLRYLATTVLTLACSAGCTGSSDEKDAGASLDAGEEAAVDAAIDAAMDSSFTGTMQCGSIPVASPKCAACADSFCCEQGQACADHPDCVDLRACRRGCAPADQACQEACESLHPEGASYDAALTACRMRQCATDCFAGADVPCGFSIAPAACKTCAETACCDVGYAANLQPTFWDYSICIHGCKDDACFDACAKQHPAGYLYYATWVGCLGTSCQTECGIATPYTCGGDYAGACASCVASHCCKESSVCHEDAACIAVEQCAGACGLADTACLDACRTSTEADTKWDALRACLAASCANDCGM